MLGRSDLRIAGVALLATLAAVFAWVSPIYEVPQNDDWAYAQTVFESLGTGVVPWLGWADPPILAQVAWGAAFVSVLGESYTSLRLATLTLAGLCLLCFFALLRELGTGRGVALLGAGALLLNPLFLTLSYSFNTEVPYVCAATAATLLFLRALRGSSDAAFLAAGFVSALAYLVRQQAAGLVLAFAAASLASPPRRFRKAALVVLPAAAAAALYELWFRGVAGTGSFERFSNLHPFVRSPGGQRLESLLVAAGFNCFAGLLTLGILSAPLLAGWLAARGTERGLKVSAAIASALLAPGVAFLAAGGRLWPFQGAYLTRAGALPLWDSPQVAPDGVWIAATLLAPLAAGWLAAAGVFLTRQASARGLRLVVAAGAMQLLPALATQEFYDRYLVCVLPAALAVAAVALGRTRGGRAAAATALLAAGLVSAEWTRAYVDEARARWWLGQAMLERGAAPETIGVTWEWEAHHLYRTARQRFAVHPPWSYEESWPWQPLLRLRYQVARVAKTPATPLLARSYRPFFSRTPVELGVFDAAAGTAMR